MEIIKNIFSLNFCENLVSSFDTIPPGPHYKLGWDVRSIYGDVTINNNGNSINEVGDNPLLFKLIQEHLPIKLKRDIIWMQMTRYQAGAYLSEHIDSYANETLTVVLSDNFKGGITYIDSKPLNLGIGDAVYFTGSRLKHKITSVEEGTRYALNIWFKPQTSGLI